MKLTEFIIEELLPSSTGKEDMKLLKKMKILYKLDKKGFDEQLAKINMTRRSEGLDALHKNEFLGKTLKKELKKERSIEKENIGRQKIKEKRVKKSKSSISIAAPHIGKMHHIPLSGAVKKYGIHNQKVTVVNKDSVYIDEKPVEIGISFDYEPERRLGVKTETIDISYIKTNYPYKVKTTRTTAKVIFPTFKKILVVSVDSWGNIELSMEKL